MTQTDRSVAIIGCGWLGLPLAEKLIADGLNVYGSTTSPEKIALLRVRGINAHLFSFESAADVPAELLSCDAVFVNVPPGRRDAERRRDYPEWMRSIAESLAHDSLLVFASSTSVYPDVDGDSLEQDAGTGELRGAGDTLWRTEQLLKAIRPNTSILRYGGLYGYDRKPGRFFAGRHDVPGGLDPVNMVHRDDAVEVARRLVNGNIRGETLNVCADEHPPKHQFYTVWARREGFDPPVFKMNHARRKRVRNDALRHRLRYSFLFPDPLMPAP